MSRNDCLRTFEFEDDLDQNWCKQTKYDDKTTIETSEKSDRRG
jgi:hypothetical protein